MSAAVETFMATLRAHGQRPALVEAERQLSYAQLLLETQARAEQLHQLGAQRLGLALDNGVEWVLWDLAALMAGVVCIPLPGFSLPSNSVMCWITPV